MREQLNDITRADTEELMKLVAGESGLLAKRFLADPSTKEEIKRLYVASQVAAIDLSKDRDDAAQHFALTMLAVIGMFDLYICRHPEFVDALYTEQVAAQWAVEDILTNLGKQL